MDSEAIELLISDGIFPVMCIAPEVEETHISWVILCKHDVYKIKKPMVYDFLDFGTLEKRKYFCEQEVLLNNRLTKDIYLGVVPISQTKGNIIIDNNSNVIDYAVHMRRLPSQKRMDLMLTHGAVDYEHMRQLARVLAEFHQVSEVKTNRPLDLLEAVNDLSEFRDYVDDYLGNAYAGLIERTCRFNENFLSHYSYLLEARCKNGFVRDCHGDLHARNIFLLEEPVIFDCIEFNESLRHIDVLNEIAFLCMDLEAKEFRELSEYFFRVYNKRNMICCSTDERRLFTFFKAYRSNVRAKVNLLRAQSSSNDPEHLKMATLYLDLMSHYLDMLMETGVSFSH